MIWIENDIMEKEEGERATDSYYYSPLRDVELVVDEYAGLEDERVYGDLYTAANFLSDWQITKELGEGGYGKVYKIERRKEGCHEHAALKVISIPKSKSEYDAVHYSLRSDEKAKRYFTKKKENILKEIRTMQSLKGCANIAILEDWDIVRKNELGWDIYIRMELLTPFKEWFRIKEATEDEVIKLGIDVCTALVQCDKEDCIHRDIKPENILVNKHGDYKLADFGMSRTLDHTTNVTRAGTPPYMPPEIHIGNVANGTADLYSLGLVMYELLNERRLPFVPKNYSQRDVQAAIQKRLDGEKIPEPVNGSAELKRIILKACEYDHNKRYSSADQMKYDLERYLITGAAANTDMQISYKKPAVLYDTEEPLVITDTVFDLAGTTQNSELDDEINGILVQEGNNAEKSGKIKELLEKKVCEERINPFSAILAVERARMDDFPKTSCLKDLLERLTANHCISPGTAVRLFFSSTETGIAQDLFGAEFVRYIAREISTDPDMVLNALVSSEAGDRTKSNMLKELAEELIEEGRISPDEAINAVITAGIDEYRKEKSLKYLLEAMIRNGRISADKAEKVMKSVKVNEADTAFKKIAEGQTDSYQAISSLLKMDVGDADKTRIVKDLLVKLVIGGYLSPDEAVIAIMDTETGGMWKALRLRELMEELVKAGQISLKTAINTIIVSDPDGSDVAFHLKELLEILLKEEHISPDTAIREMESARLNVSSKSYRFRELLENLVKGERLSSDEAVQALLATELDASQKSYRFRELLENLIMGGYLSADAAIQAFQAANLDHDEKMHHLETILMTLSRKKYISTDEAISAFQETADKDEKRKVARFIECMEEYKKEEERETEVT